MRSNFCWVWKSLQSERFLSYNNNDTALQAIQLLNILLSPAPTNTDPRQKNKWFGWVMIISRTPNTPKLVVLLRHLKVAKGLAICPFVKSSWNIPASLIFLQQTKFCHQDLAPIFYFTDHLQKKVKTTQRLRERGSQVNRATDGSVIIFPADRKM